jgi:ABC-type transporter Mla subunit MlaD
MSENFQNSQEQTDALILSLLDLHAEEVTVDTADFLDLLKHSLSLNTMEKKRVIDAAATLSQFQFDELTKVFVEEREKFRELAKEHPEDIKKLLVKQQNEWNELGEIYEREQEQKAQQSEEADKIDDIKAGLGL